jgi:hypothetical protein
MAWRRLEDTFHSDRKIRKLARELGIEEPHAAGHIATLWSWALLHAKDGDLTKFDVDDIEHGAKWNGDHGDFFNACATTRLIDQEPDGRALLHNWIERGGSYAESQRKALKNKGKKTFQEIPGNSRKFQERPGKSALEEKRIEEKRIETCKVEHEPKSKNVNPADQATTSSADAADQSPKIARDDVDEVWQHYRTHHPRVPKVLKVSRKEYRLIRQRLEDFTVDDLKAAIDGYHASPFHCGENDRQTKYLSLELMMRDVSKVQAGLELVDGRNGNRRRAKLDDAVPGAISESERTNNDEQIN